MQMTCLSYGRGVCLSVRLSVTPCDSIKTTQGRVTKSSIFTVSAMEDSSILPVLHRLLENINTELLDIGIAGGQYSACRPDCIANSDCDYGHQLNLLQLAHQSTATLSAGEVRFTANQHVICDVKR